MVIYGSGTELSNSAPVFAGQLIGMYTESIGAWSYWIIAIAAFSTMFSTTITVLDGYGRVMSRLTELLRDKKNERAYSFWIILVALGAFAVISQFLGNLKQLVDIATILSFIVAPAAAFINFKAIFSKDIAEEFRPPKWLKTLAVLGLIFLSVFTLVYFYALAM
jgi:Mn2+/Fe2+ NRAMP family transporter